MKKIVSYSLWCQDKPMDGYKYQTHNMYINGAIRNLEIHKKKIYTRIGSLDIISIIQFLLKFKIN